jgi:hypothetical protein
MYLKSECRHLRATLCSDNSLFIVCHLTALKATSALQVAAMAVRLEETLLHYSRGLVLVARLWQMGALMRGDIEVRWNPDSS